MSTIGLCISFVGSSNWKVIDFQILVRTVHRDDIFAREVAFSLVEFSFIAKAESPTLSFLRADGGERQMV